MLDTPLVRYLAYALFVPFLVGCSSCTKDPASTTADAEPSASARRVPPARSSWPVPGGPRLAILAGQGVGPIRFGATVATVERHMQAPCDLKNDKLCRYYARAVDFELTDGVVTGIVVQRMYREAGIDANGKPRTYGVFNGAIPPDLSFGMLPEAIQQGLGQPKRIEKVEQGGENRTRERHHYDGLLLEYDNIEGEMLALGSVRVIKK